MVRMKKKKILIVIDMQYDFIYGSLKTKEAPKIIKHVVKKIKEYDKKNIYLTQDTHSKNYLKTQEGKNLPVKHCIKNTKGWEIIKEVKELIDKKNIYEKNVFGSKRLAEDLSKKKNIKEIEIIGLCTDICVVVNAMLIKTYMPEIKILVDSKCCAGVTKKSHKEALETMKMCQIEVK